jgi:hypothetical protein
VAKMTKAMMMVVMMMMMMMMIMIQTTTIVMTLRLRVLAMRTLVMFRGLQERQFKNAISIL